MTDLQHLRAALADRYRIADELGRGGMATVYLAEDLRHSRPVAVKVVRPEMVQYVGRDRFLREIRITAGLAHPHIGPLLDSGEVDGLLYYVMPHVEGASLSDRLKTEGPLAIDEALRLAAEVADALEYAHQQDIVHRDVKPSNILLEAGHAILCDFGVALPTATPPATRMTQSGVTLGTAEYMSPEQCSGEHRVDARSDVYSLGCVAYEMLTGTPPFTAKTPAAVVAKQLRDQPSRFMTLRDGIPNAVERVVLKALEKDPAKRFQSAGEFREALLASVTQQSMPLVPVTGQMRLAGAVLGVVATLALVMGLLMSRTPDLELDEGRYAVASFYQVNPEDMRGMDGSRCQTRLRQALAQWEGVELVDDAITRDLELRRAGRPVTRTAVLADAAAAGAGRLIWGQVWTEADSVHVEGRLYDVASGTVLRSQVLAFGPGGNVPGLFTDMADSLLVGSVTSQAAGREGAIGTRSLAALTHFEDGQRYLDSWDLQEAGEAFAAAVEEDPGYVQASLWRSLVGLFQGGDFEEWRAYAAAAARSEEALSARERLLARGLLELAEGRWQEACGDFSQAVARDSTNFGAWIGLGECLSRDEGVEADPDSPTGWRFRTSYEAAGQAITRALELAPSFNAVLGQETEGQVERVFPVRVGNVRQGFGGEGDTVRFAALPEILDDTIAYHPVPLLELGGAGIPTTTVQAVRRNQESRSAITEAWLRAFPDSPDALSGHAQALEARGLIAPTGDPATSALDAWVAARERLSRDRIEERVRFGAAHVRLLVKNGAFGEAVALADSVLVWDAGTAVAALQGQAGLALLRGRPNRAADLLQAAAPEYDFALLADPALAPVALRETVLRHLAFTSTGGPLDSLEAVRQRAYDEAARMLPSGQRDQVLAAIMSNGLMLTFTVLPVTERDPPDQRGNIFLPLLRSLASGDTASVRAGVEMLSGMSENISTGGVPFTLGWVDAHLKLGLGDVTGAAAQMDRLLSSLRSQDELLLLPPDAGVLVRTMIAAAGMAGLPGHEALSEWAGPAAVLWGDGEPFARSTVEALSQALPPSGT